MSVTSAAYCINPDCPRPSAQLWGSKFCHSCGAPLELRNRYIPLQKLGSGGFATIYTIWDLQTKTEQVLKVLVETNPKALELFEHEAAVLASLRHPGVPRVEPDSYFQVTLSYPQKRSLPCLVMEKIHGKTLEDILNEYPQGCPEALVLNWLKQSLEILDELHRRNIIHRDIKPSNLMLRQDTGQLVAIDFGGAKQIGSKLPGSKGSSTRLISPGYSPPEQISGGVVGPGTDFYALGRTMIHLLTAKYPADLESPDGELQWRSYAHVSPVFAEVLDGMVQADVQQRPANAAYLKLRLGGISTMNTTPSWAASKAPLSINQNIARVLASGLNLVWAGITTIGKGIATTTFLMARAIVKVVFACLDTTIEMLLGGIGASVGALTGFGLAYWTPLGTQIAHSIIHQMPKIDPHVVSIVAPQMLLFAVAGLGTAVGLSEAGGFGQQRRVRVAGLIGFLGYGLGWLIGQAAYESGVEQSLVGFITVAIASLTLGLRLPSHHLVHALVTTGGTGIICAVLVNLNLLPAYVLVNFFSLATKGSLAELGTSIAFFGLLGITVAFWLGVSYYIFVPLLRWLGWR